MEDTFSLRDSFVSVAVILNNPIKMFLKALNGAISMESASP